MASDDRNGRRRRPSERKRAEDDVDLHDGCPRATPEEIVAIFGAPYVDYTGTLTQIDFASLSRPSPRTFKCPRCPESFGSQRDVAAHMAASHALNAQEAATVGRLLLARKKGRP